LPHDDHFERAGIHPSAGAAITSHCGKCLAAEYGRWKNARLFPSPARRRFARVATGKSPAPPHMKSIPARELGRDDVRANAQVKEFTALAGGYFI